MLGPLWSLRPLVGAVGCPGKRALAASILEAKFRALLSVLGRVLRGSACTTMRASVTGHRLPLAIMPRSRDIRFAGGAEWRPPRCLLQTFGRARRQTLDRFQASRLRGAHGSPQGGCNLSRRKSGLTDFHSELRVACPRFTWACVLHWRLRHGHIKGGHATQAPENQALLEP